MVNVMSIGDEPQQILFHLPQQVEARDASREATLAQALSTLIFEQFYEAHA